MRSWENTNDGIHEDDAYLSNLDLTFEIDGRDLSFYLRYGRAGAESGRPNAGRTPINLLKNFELHW